MKRNKNFIESQQKKSLKNLKSSLKKTQSYNCDKCRDLTFILDGDVAVSCDCRSLRQTESILKLSGISEEFRKKTFDSFNYAYDIQTIDAYSKAIGYYSSFLNSRSSRKNSIMFLGQVGSGKTHLSLAIANKLMDDGFGVLYMPYRDVITRIKQNVMNGEEYERIVNRYKNAKVLLIDDLFKGSISKSDVNIVFEIVNFRYFNNLPMIVSCEKGADELLDIDEAIGSRLIEMSKDYLVEMKGRKLNFRIYSK
ncbi:DNA replication protein [Paeniclostridium sordellii]|nr:DNA replication protein [Paeniclostridium sordellii]